jgi:hypothetical protein
MRTLIPDPAATERQAYRLTRRKSNERLSEVNQLTSNSAQVGHMAHFEYVFPAIRGVQAGREYYVSMCPLRLIPRILLFDDDELRPELRAQRTLNKTRVPEIARFPPKTRKSGSPLGR